jgi:tetratricopeptide (TPR) repeat protein
MRRITIAGIAALVLIGGALLWARGRTRPHDRGLELTDGVHFIIDVDSAAPGGAAFLHGVRARQWRRAEREARRAVRSHPGSADAHFHLRMVLIWRGKLEEAVCEWREALRLDPHHEYAARMLASPALGAIH